MRLQSIALLILFVAVCALPSNYAQDSTSELQPQQTDAVRSRTEKPQLLSFSFYKKHFKKHYGSIIEMLRRQKIFMGRALRAFVSGIKYRLYKLSYFLSINPFSDETPEERAKHLVDPNDLLEDFQSVDDSVESDYQKSAEMAIKSEIHVRRKRNTFNSAKRNIRLEDLIEPSEELVNLTPETERKISSDVKSNNPNYEEPKLNVVVDQLSSTPNRATYIETLDPPTTNSLKPKKLVKSSEVTRTAEIKVNASTDGEFVDLRDDACFLRARRQGNCGACWAFSVIAMYEFLFCKYTGTLLPFSEQFLIDCGRHAGLKGCGGEKLSKGARFVNTYGLETRAHYPYRETDDVCPYENDFDAEKIGYIKIKDAKSVFLDHSLIDTYLKENRKPILFALRVPIDFFDYGGGVADGTECGRLGGHGMLLCGYGREDGKDYYLFRNSHTASWGEQGYYKFNKNDLVKCAISRGIVTHGYFETAAVKNKNPNHNRDILKRP